MASEDPNRDCSVTVRLTSAELRQLDHLVSLARITYPTHSVTRGSVLRRLIGEKARRVAREPFASSEPGRGV